MNNLDVARALFEIADLLELQGEDLFKVRAYRKAAEQIELLLEEVEAMHRRGALTTIPGVGKAIAAKVAELLTTGRLAYLEELRRAIPPGVGELTRVPGLAAKTAALLYERLGIDSLDRLELAARQGELRDLPGMGPKKEAAILAGLEKLRTRGDAIALGSVLPVAEALAEYLRRHPAVLSAEVAGSIRRRKELVTDIDIVVASEQPAAVISYIKSLPVAGEAVAEGPDHINLMTSLGRRMDVRVVPPARYAVTLLQMTGSEEHLQDLKGDLHTHTRASDGTATATGMAEAARALGHQYLAICDHSRSLAIAGGLPPDQVRRQGVEIERVNAELADPDFRLLRGTEVDILKDGSLDFPDDLLQELDVVVASIHSHMKLDAEAQTERLVQAAKHPHVDIIGHPTGRVLNRRDPYPLDFERVADACARTGTALEISASPARLDLSDLHARFAKQRGVKLAINTDAHTTRELQLLPYGVGQARRAWIEPGDVVNAMDLGSLLAWLAKEKG